MVFSLLWSMPTKTHHVQIRVTAREKSALRRLASRSGLDLSSYILGRALPSQRLRFEEILRALGNSTDGRNAADRRFALAELNDFLTALSAAEFADAVADADVRALDPLTANYTTALVEQCADRHRMAAQGEGRGAHLPPIRAAGPGGRTPFAG